MKALLPRAGRRRARRAADRSLRRFVAAGATVGASLGTLWALAVVNFADCEGPNCTRERVLGVLGHALVGALAGILLGMVLGLLVRWLRRPA